MFVTRVLHPAVGVVSSTCWMVSLFLSNAQFGVSSKANMFAWVFGVVAAALIFYYLVRWILRARRGVKLELVYAEIPPE
jgi:hypothetical protein